MALSKDTFGYAGGAASDLFSGIGSIFSSQNSAAGLRLKATGDLAEAEQYDLAGHLARQNEEFARTSTELQQMQQQRSTAMQIGGQEAAIAGAGFAESGSGLDILADSARQGALAHAVVGQQGLINEAAYEEQAQSYDIMSRTARNAAATENEIAGKTETAGSIAAFGNFAGGLLKGAAAIATL